MPNAAAALAWEDPPPRRGGPGADPVEREIADALAANAGEWAVVATYASQHAAVLLQRRIRRGAAGSAWAAGYEAVVRKHGGDAWRVYARATPASNNGRTDDNERETP